MTAPARPADPLLDCLAALAALHGRALSAEALSAGLPLIHGRLAPEQVPAAAARAGLSARLHRRPLDRIPAAALPALLLLDGGAEACLLSRLDGEEAELILPESGLGTCRVRRADLARRHDGRVLFVRPEYRPREDAEPAPPRRWFWGTLAALWPVYGEVAVAALLVNAFALAVPLFVMNVYDRVVPNQALETLWVLAAGTALVLGFDLLMRTLRGRFLDHAGRRADTAMAARLFAQVLGMKLAARPGSPGALAATLREFETLREFFAASTLVALIDLPFALFFVAIVWLLAGPVALAPALALPVLLAAGLLLRLPLGRAVRRAQRATAERHAMLVESVAGLETIKSLGAEGRRQGEWEALAQAAARHGERARGWSGLGANLAVFVQQAVTVAVVVHGVHRIAAGELSVGALVAATILTGRALAPLAQAANVLARLDQALAALAQLDRVMALAVERPAGRRFVSPPAIRGAVEFREVTFRYPGAAVPALKEVSFRMAAGERVAVLGRSGSGKTTLARLVLNLYEPDSGAVLVDGLDVRQIDPADLRRSIGAVLQDAVLFRGTLRDNIAAPLVRADDQAMLAAARLAGADGIAAAHPAGYDLMVAERGDNLSGGQRQAVALARALVGAAPLLLLDEPTSAMDGASEAGLVARLKVACAGRTLLLVTHRPALLDLVGRVIVLDGGRVVADGPRGEVLSALARAPAAAE